MAWLSDLTLDTVIVHIVNGGPSLRGNKVAVYNDGILLSDVVNLDVEPLVAEDGHQLIPREQIERVQLLGSSA